MIDLERFEQERPAQAGGICGERHSPRPTPCDTDNNRVRVVQSAPACNVCGGVGFDPRGGRWFEPCRKCGGHGRAEVMDDEDASLNTDIDTERFRSEL